MLRLERCHTNTTTKTRVAYGNISTGKRVNIRYINSTRGTSSFFSSMFIFRSLLSDLHFHRAPVKVTAPRGFEPETSCRRLVTAPPLPGSPTRYRRVPCGVVSLKRRRASVPGCKPRQFCTRNVSSDVIRKLCKRHLSHRTKTASRSGP